MTHTQTVETNEFAADVLAGLSSRPKWLSSKYFYDDEGSRLFREIMDLPEYYLTQCEREIFQEQRDDIFDALDTGEGFDLVELGAGDGTKTAVLIEHFLTRFPDLAYTPIDISDEALGKLEEEFHRLFPSLDIRPLQGDYFKILGSIRKARGRRKVLMFLGSNIGNFSHEDSVDFFRSLRSVMADDDLLFVGFDLQKDPRVIVPAYDDPAGVTARFNLNLLNRINRELGADFDLEQFSHYANYRPIEGSARSFLISRVEQTVTIETLGRSFHFDQWEAVFMEISRKYTPRSISEMAAESGFAVKRNFFDSRRYYCDSLWQKA